VLPLAAMRNFVQMLSPFAPHIAEELWERLGGTGTITYEPWPEYDEALTVDDEIEIVVQVNGKIVERMMVASDIEEEAMREAALRTDKVKAATEGKTVRKVIVVKGKLVNIVVG